MLYNDDRKDYKWRSTESFKNHRNYYFCDCNAIFKIIAAGYIDHHSDSLTKVNDPLAVRKPGGYFYATNYLVWNCLIKSCIILYCLTNKVVFFEIYVRIHRSIVSFIIFTCCCERFKYLHFCFVYNIYVFGFVCNIYVLLLYNLNYSIKKKNWHWQLLLRCGLSNMKVETSKK